MALTKSTVKYRDLGSSGTMKIRCVVYRETVKTAHPYRNIHSWAVPYLFTNCGLRMTCVYSPLVLVMHKADVV